MAPIGVFDSGYGGLTVFKEMAALLPNYDYVYLGDNARAPYGNRSFDTVHQFTWQAVQWLFGQGCPLVILACNTASAKALRTIQQQDLPVSTDATRRVLGVIRPTTEQLGFFTKSGQVGIMATQGTVASGSYPIELAKFFPNLNVYQQACPMWVPLVETNMHLTPGADFFVRYYLDKLLAQAPAMDTVLLACTHYPLLLPRIRSLAPAGIRFVTQGNMVAQSLANYLQRHPQMAARLTTGSSRHFYTTDDPDAFNQQGTAFFGAPIASELVHL